MACAACDSNKEKAGVSAERAASSTAPAAASASTSAAAASSAAGSAAQATPGASGSAATSAEPVASAEPSAEPTASAAPASSAKPDASSSVATPKPKKPKKPKVVDKGPPAPSSSGGSLAVTPSAVPVVAPGPAAPGSADAVADKVDAVYLPIQRFRARFEQRYIAKIAGTTKNSDGVCYVKRPGKISFSYHKPNKNRVVSDGVTLKIYEAENAQMFVKSVATTEYPGALAFIMGKGLRYSFTFTFNESAKWEGGPVLVGTPRVANPGYEKVLFYIDEALLAKGDPACVRRVLVIDAQGNRNRFDFIHVEQPDEIGESEFTFEAPPGTNIVK
jgi:outer membrane lipoprotein carrier protein